MWHCGCSAMIFEGCKVVTSGYKIQSSDTAVLQIRRGIKDNLGIIFHSTTL